MIDVFFKQHDTKKQEKLQNTCYFMKKYSDTIM